MVFLSSKKRLKPILNYAFINNSIPEGKNIQNLEKSPGNFFTKKILVSSVVALEEDRMKDDS